MRCSLWFDPRLRAKGEFVVLLFLCTSPCYWLLVWQYWQRVWKWFDPRLRTRFGELVVLLFIFNIFRYCRLSFILSLVCFRATVGEFAVLLFLGTSPCSPSARLSACCRNQSFPENREKHHQAIILFRTKTKINDWQVLSFNDWKVLSLFGL